MAIQNGNAHAADHGLRALALFLRLHGVHAEPEQLRESCGSSTIGIRALLRCARRFGVEVRSRTTHWTRLANLQLPGIASLRDGGFLLLGKVDDNGALVLHPTASRPELMTRAEFEEIWDGRLILTGSQNVINRVLHALADMSVTVRGLARRAVAPVTRARDTVMRARDSLMRACFGERSDMALQAARTDFEAASIVPQSEDESGLVAVAILLRCHGIAADPEQIRHRMGAAKLGVTEILRCAKEFGLKARAQRSSWDRLAVTPLPGIALLRDGGSNVTEAAFDVGYNSLSHFTKAFVAEKGVRPSDWRAN